MRSPQLADGLLVDLRDTSKEGGDRRLYDDRWTSYAGGNAELGLSSTFSKYMFFNQIIAVFV